jgi:hypothetical protein
MINLILYLHFSDCDDLIVNFIKKKHDNIHICNNASDFTIKNTKMYKYLIIGDSNKQSLYKNENMKTLLSLFANKQILGIGNGCLFLNNCDKLICNNLSVNEVGLFVDKRFKVLSLMKKIEYINVKENFFYNLDYDENEVKVIVETISFESIIYKKLYKDHYGLIVNDFVKDEASICKKLIEGFLSF